MTRGARCFLMVCLSAALLPSALAKEKDLSSQVPLKILRADSVYIDCDVCVRALAEAGKIADQQLLIWKRFRVVQDRKQADLIFMFSANAYLGDYVTRDGPDKRPVMIDRTILTIVDPKTGEELWSDARIWGSWRVASATKELIEELRGEMETEIKRWTIDDILSCAGTLPYSTFAHMASEDALKSSAMGVSPIANAADRLSVSSHDVPEFCRQAQLVIGPDNKIAGFEVLVPQSEALVVSEVLAQADEFEFGGGKDARSHQVFFTALSKDRKILLHFDTQGHRTNLTRVSYSY
jgi:hypothetical protein